MLINSKHSSKIIQELTELIGKPNEDWTNEDFILVKTFIQVYLKHIEEIYQEIKFR